MDPRRDDRSFKQSSRSHHDDVEYGVAMTKVATRLFTRNEPLTLTICLSRLLQVQNRPVEKERLANFLAKNNVGLVILIVLPLVKSYTHELQARGRTASVLRTTWPLQRPLVPVRSVQRVFPYRPACKIVHDRALWWVQRSGTSMRFWIGNSSVGGGMHCYVAVLLKHGSFLRVRSISYHK